MTVTPMTSIVTVATKTSNRGCRHRCSFSFSYLAKEANGYRFEEFTALNINSQFQMSINKQITNKINKIIIIIK